MEIVDLPLGEFRHDLELPEALQLAHEIGGEIAEQMLGADARLLGRGRGFAAPRLRRGARAAWTDRETAAISAPSARTVQPMAI